MAEIAVRAAGIGGSALEAGTNIFLIVSSCGANPWGWYLLVNGLDNGQAAVLGTNTRQAQGLGIIVGAATGDPKKGQATANVYDVVKGLGDAGLAVWQLYRLRPQAKNPKLPGQPEGARTGAQGDRLGPKPPHLKKPQAHHDLPQAERFQKHWNRLGIDIDDPAYGRWVEGGPNGNHQKWSYEFNKEWDKFFEKYPEATLEQVLDFMRILRIDPRFQ